MRWTPEQFDAYQARLRTEKAERLKVAAKNMGFTVRDAFCGPTLEFPGADIDAVHKRSKYGNKRENGFASKREARRHEVLMLRAKAREISELRCQVPFRIEINDELVCTYKADFTYMEGGALIVEDTKGYRTPVYRLKKRLMKAVHGIEIREI
jgi:hypothetical protein